MIRGFLSSITGRLILGLTVATTLLWCGAAGYSTYVSSRELNEAFDQALKEVSRRLLPLASDDFGGHHDSDDARAIEHLLDGRAEYLSYQLRDSSGQVVLRAHDAPTVPFERTVREGFSTANGHRLYTVRDHESGLTLTVAEPMHGRWEALWTQATAMLWPLAVLVPLNMLVIWLAVRGSMRPVLRLSGDISRRGERNLAALDISGQPAELRPIAEAVAHLIERLRAALDAERAFAAVSAHELRTPIAGALAQTQRLIAELEGAADRKRAGEIEATLKRLSGLAEKLMQLSRIEAGVAIADRAVDLVPVLDLVVDDCRKRQADPGRLVYRRPESGALTARMDLDAFAMAVRNLLDNALLHGAADQPVTIDSPGPGALRIVNGGPVVPEKVLAGLKQRFARGDTRESGSGLGLAIAETVLMQTGGRLELLSPATGRDDGFEARIALGRGQGDW